MNKRDNTQPVPYIRPVDQCLAHQGIVEAIGGVKRTLNALLVLHGALIAGVCALLLKGCNP